MKTILDKKEIPETILNHLKTLKNGGFEGYLVGGCVRDLLLGKEPKDWDITTNATPEEIIGLFTKTFYENSFGTVGVVEEEESDLKLRLVEITPYRTETTYSDNRHPDEVTFSKKIEDDVSRRDFTINALAYDPIEQKLVDMFEGVLDIEKKVIRAVGDPSVRFREDSLRMLRAVRFQAELGFVIDLDTQNGLIANKDLIKNVSFERIRDEFIKIMESQEPAMAIEMAHRLGILEYFIPEIVDAIGIDQNQAHSFDVWTHLLKSAQHGADKGYPTYVKIAALLHDIGKPPTREFSEEKNDWSFHGHEVVGSRMARKILKRLKFPKEQVELITLLVRWHMFFSDTEQVTLSAVRRLIRNVGKEHIWDLINLRICDRIGTGRPKENPYRLRKFKSMIDEVLSDPVSVGMLKTNGDRILEISSEKPGPRLGLVLHALLEEVLDDPGLNTTEYLEKRALELLNLPEDELFHLGTQGRDKKEEQEDKRLGELRKKHHVR
jgi:tRNA nucleotidyltransferase (CCA-adding enzyme)